MSMIKGIDSLKAAVMNDCAEGENCFSENGCTKVRYLKLPEDNPNLLAMGIKTKCVANTKCQHDYCGKYKWVLERAKNYADRTGKSVEDILEIWESNRTYWYMNYYQENNQPMLDDTNVLEYNDWLAELRLRFGADSKKWAFKCPSCGNVQTAEDFVKHEVADFQDKVYHSCIGRWVTGVGCDWTLGGFMQIHKCSVLKDGQVFSVFEMAETKADKGGEG